MMNHTATFDKDQVKLLNQVREGMTVYDSDRKDIGSVDTIYFGAVSDEEYADGAIPATAPTRKETPGENTFVGGLLEAFDPRDEIPEELAKRLNYSGFIRIDGGWFGADRYVTPDQISSVSSEGVYLNTKRENVIRE